MQDFIRIGGEVISSPLNENFRRLLNAISIANVNLVFPEENGVVNTVADMYAIPNPQSAQTCYVISSGELYRYDKSGEHWYRYLVDFNYVYLPYMNFNARHFSLLQKQRRRRKIFKRNVCYRSSRNRR